MTTSLLARDLTLGYGDAPIVSELSLEVQDDSFTIIIGPNACSKSSLLRGLARLLRPTAGAVLLDGAELQVSRRHTRELKDRLMRATPRPGS